MKKLIVILGICLLFVACHSNPRTRECVKQIVSFVENQKDSCIHYSDADWDRVNRVYIDLLKEADKYIDRLSVDEKIQIARATTTYVLLQKHRNKEDLKNSLKPELDMGSATDASLHHFNK